MIAGPEGGPSADSQRCEGQAGRHRACRIGAGPRRTYPICWLDIHKQQNAIAVAESGRSVAVDYLREIARD